MDADAYRADSRDSWERAAGGWTARREAIQQSALAVSERLIELGRLQPGQDVLEVAAGLGDTGLLAAELVKPGGRVMITDGADAMVEAAKAHVEASGADNVQVRQMEAEWLDVSTALFDVVLSRWGYMLLADPEAALREARRVLRPGGRIALAVWAPLADNPWIGVLQRELARARARGEARARHARHVRARGARATSTSCSPRPASPTSRSSHSTSPGGRRASTRGGTTSARSRSHSTPRSRS